MLCGECEEKHYYTLTLEKKNKIQMISFIAFLSRLIESAEDPERNLFLSFSITQPLFVESAHTGGQVVWWKIILNHINAISGLKVCAVKSWFHISRDKTRLIKLWVTFLNFPYNG